MLHMCDPSFLVRSYKRYSVAEECLAVHVFVLLYSDYEITQASVFVM